MPNAHANDPVARMSRPARIAYSVMCAPLRRIVSQVPSPELRLGTDEKAKITAAQRTTGSQRSSARGLTAPMIRM